MALALWTVAPDQPFVQTLAQALLDGSLLPEAGIAAPPSLSQWTVLVPNRRSARFLAETLHNASGRRAMLLPRIKPIGDIDEDMLEDMPAAADIPDAIPQAGQLNVLLTLVMEWASTHDTHPLARDVLTSGVQAFQLAVSLQEVLNQIETEEAAFTGLAAALRLDQAEHGSAILSLMDLLSREMPQRLGAAGLIGPSARRNLMIRLEAERVASGRQRGPIVAAGSTGTNPATRALLKAIASHPKGAVVLPGLDLLLDEPAWNAIGPEHPQFGLKQMLQNWEVPRHTVQVLGGAAGPRQALASLALRPADAAEGWPEVLAAQRHLVVDAMHDLELVEAADRQQEARIIALRLRQHVHEGGKHGALITPDRDLARRVQVELQRWNLTIDDSAGVPLCRFGLARLMVLLLEAIDSRFAIPQLLALLHHEDCTLGLGADVARAAARGWEISCLRGRPAPEGLQGLAAMVATVQQETLRERHAHPLVKALTADDWAAISTLVARLVAVLQPFAVDRDDSFAAHLARLREALQALAPEADMNSPVNATLMELLDGLQLDSRWHPVTTLERAQHSILSVMQRETLRPIGMDGARLAIYGLPEARLMQTDLAILGGLAEGAWPAAAQTGPWLNRPSRKELGLAVPERDLGLTGHDFAQALGQPKVMLTWPRRIGTEMVSPCRWITRLRAVMDASGISMGRQLNSELPRIARALDQGLRFSPRPRPQARPPVAARPRRFSVTQVERLVRDSYGIYASRVLRLEPLPPLTQELDAALRGTLIHEALAAWTRQARNVPASSQLSLLMAKGESAFAPYLDLPEVARFWWVRFARMAQAMVAIDDDLRRSSVSSLVEIGGLLKMQVDGVEHELTARADRIDILHNGALRLIDYKSGRVPTDKQVKTGFAPQMLLEAALAERGGFRGLETDLRVDDACYIQVGGGREPATLSSLQEMKIDVPKEATAQFERFQGLLRAYLNPETAYIPRHNLLMEEDPTPYDHLSRRQEWQQAVPGEGPDADAEGGA